MESAPTLNPRRILDAIRFSWKWALPTGIVLAMISSAVVYLLFEPQYQASAWLRIEENTPYLAFEVKDEQSKGFVQTQIELLRSPMVLGPVIAEHAAVPVNELAQHDNPTEWLSKRIIVKAVGNSELYTVSYNSPNPKSATSIVNAVLDSYFKLRSMEHGQRLERVIKILDAERSSRMQEVDTLRKALRELAKEVTGTDPFQSTPEPTTKENKALTDLASRLAASEVEESVLRAKVQVLEGIDSKQSTPIPDIVVERAVSANPQVVKATEALAAKKSQLRVYETRGAQGKESPIHQRATLIVEKEEKSLEELKSALWDHVKQSLEAERQGKQSEELSMLRSDLENRRITRELLKDRYEAELRSTKQLNGDTVTFRFKQEELARAEKVLDLISERMVKLQTERGAPPRVWEMKRATLPTAAIASLPYINLCVAVVVGLCVPFGLGILREQLASRVSSADFVEEHARLAVLGEITHLPTRSAGRTSLGYREQRTMHIFEESMDAMRTNLLLGAQSGAMRFLCVTSAINQEGKTSVAVQLAASTARATGQRVLIIDGDLRSPSIHGAFQLSLEPGLVDVLRGTCTLEAAIAPTWAECVDALPAGALRVNPHALVTNDRWEAFLQSIPAEYRYVIIDTPPVLAASESLVLSRGADAVLICAMKDVTRLAQLNKAADRIISTGAKVAGLVLNGVPTRHYADRYGSYPYLSL